MQVKRTRQNTRLAPADHYLWFNPLSAEEDASHPGVPRRQDDGQTNTYAPLTNKVNNAVNLDMAVYTALTAECLPQPPEIFPRLC